jgi:CSLREA domain-containing protein
MRIKKLLTSLALGLGLSLGLVGLLGSGLAVVRAADFTVNTTTDENDGSCTDGDCSLRDAIIIANGNGEADTITLGSNTYGLSLIGVNENAGATGDLDITAPLTIIGQGPGQTIIDASGVISDRVFHINMSADVGTVVISGVTIINGNTTGSGGGIYNYDADLILVNTVISNNITNSYGGGVNISRGSLTLHNTQILSNTAGDRGGGVYVYHSTAAFTQTNGSLIAYNHVAGSGGFRGGGGLYVSEGSAMLNGGQIFSNTANDNGGGVYVLLGSAILAGGQILSNTANDNGGGVYVYEGSTMLSGAEIRGNKANSGGGVHVDVGSAALSDGQILGNTAGQYGGGVYVGDGSATLSGGQIHHNTAGYGGGVYLDKGRATLTGGEILSNTANNDGGGVYIFGSAGAFTQTGVSIIAYNTATGNGGGVYIANGSATSNAGQIHGNKARYGGGVYVYNTTAAFTQANDATITHNTSTNNGGGLYVYQGSMTSSGGSICNNKAGIGGGLYVHQGSVSLRGETICNNTAYYGGGGVYQANGMLTLVNVTLSGNEATSITPASEGGGLYVGNGTTVLTYNTIVNNTAADGGRGIHRTGGSVLLQDTIVAYNGITNCNPGSGPGLTSNGYNLDSGATCGFSAVGDQQNTDPLLGPLADNGGDTLTHALLDGSPAIDQGTCVTGITTDQRGVSRPQGTTCDIGAFEFDPGTAPGTGVVYLPIIMQN